MMMPTLRMASLSRLGCAPKRLGGDGAEDFVEPARLQVKLLELQALSRGELGYGRQDCCARTRQGGQSRIAHADFNFSHRRKRSNSGARGLQLVRLLELKSHGVVVAGPGFERQRRVVRH